MRRLDQKLLENLDYMVHEMLGVSDGEKITVLAGVESTTAVTMRVRVAGKGGGRFFVKTTKRDGGLPSGKRLGRREVEFYGFMEGLNVETSPNIPRCVCKEIDESGDRYFLVLEDLGETHYGYDAMDFSRVETWEWTVRSLAHFQRQFAGRLPADEVECKVGSDAGVEEYIQKLRGAFERFRADHTGLIDGGILELLGESIEPLHAIEYDKQRGSKANKITTVTHGDAHRRNFLYPRVKADWAVLVDWQFWNVGIGTYDLRHLLGSTVEREMRGHQQALVHCYYDAFTRDLGVDYPWEQCWDDYRKGVLDNLFMPVWQYTGFGWGIERWGETLRSAVENYYALGCEEILD